MRSALFSANARLNSLCILLRPHPLAHSVLWTNTRFHTSTNRLCSRLYWTHAMATTHPRSRSPSTQPPEKKPRLDGSPIASAETVSIQEAPAAYQTPPNQSKKPSKQNKKNKKNARRLPDPFSSDDILRREVVALLGSDYVQSLADQDLDCDPPFEQSTQLDLTVARISPSTGQCRYSEPLHTNEYPPAFV